MTRLQKKIYTSLVVYILIVVFATIYHAFNFSDYISTEGPEIIIYVILVLAGSVMFQVFVARQSPTIDWKAAAIGTAVIFAASIFFSFAVVMKSEFDGTSTEIILTFGACNLIILSLVTVQHVGRKTVHRES